MTDDNQPMFESVVQRKFGVHLVNLRKQQGISQERLANMSGVSRSYLSGIELGKRKVSLPIICILAKALSLHQSELLNFDIDESSID